MSKILTKFSTELADTVELASQSVVRVDGRRRIGGTGIVWDPAGLIVTAHHILERDDNISVVLQDGTSLLAELVGRDPSTDLAVLRVKSDGLQAAGRVEQANLRVGNIVLALGRPGTDVRATLGIVSALGGSWRSPSGASVDSYLQTDVVMYPGFSGGPLVTANGQVAGLNSSALINGISLAVPNATISRVAEALVTHGKIRRGYLGIGSQPVKLPEALATELGQQTGALLTSVEDNSPADKGGLALGDTVVAINGKAVRTPDEIRPHLEAETIGQSVSIRILRNRQVIDVPVVVGESS